MYILSTGCQWAALPKDLPPRSTVNDYMRRWDAPFQRRAIPGGVAATSAVGNWIVAPAV
jgi:transposase